MIMKTFGTSILAILATVGLTSCSDFLTTVPKDAMSPATTWKTETDAQKFVIGCYDDWAERYAYFYWDCCSDFGYSNFSWDGFKVIGNGTMSPGDYGYSFYNFKTIRKCNTYLEQVGNVAFPSDNVKKDLEAQVRAIRAYRYFLMCSLYGGVPIIGNFQSAAEAQVPRNSEEEVRKFIMDEFNAIIPMINETPAERGRIAKGAVLAMQMRAAMFWGDYATAKSAAQSIIGLNQYALEPDYAELFKSSGQNSKEIILAYMMMNNNSSYSNWENGQMYPNGDGGWSSMVPTMNLVNNYEMANGLTIDNPASGYDPQHPFANRDPRLEMTILYPGTDWQGRIFNTLDPKLPDGSTNDDYSFVADNSSKTALSWRKYLDPMYPDIWENDCCPILYRYADVLLTWAEAENELNGPSDQVYSYIDQVRKRAGMPAVNRAEYGTKETLRTLIRRERGSEFAGEGLRRGDIIRWKDGNGKMVAETVLNENLYCISGTVDYNQAEPTLRATITNEKGELVEERVFHDYNRYFPIPQSDIDNNPKLVQNPGYN